MSDEAKREDLTRRSPIIRYMFVALAAFVLVNVGMIYTYKFRCVTYLNVFSRIIELPNSFVIDSSKVNELVFRRGKELITVGEFTGEKKFNLITYLQSGSYVNGQGCDVSYLASTPEGINTVMLFQGERYLIFWGVQGEVSEKIVSDICGTWEFKRA